MDMCAEALSRRKLPHQVRKRAGDYKPDCDAINVLTMRVSKGLEFPVVMLPGVGKMPTAGEDEKKEARVFYVAATRATQRLVIGVSGDGGFGTRLTLSRRQDSAPNAVYAAIGSLAIGVVLLGVTVFVGIEVKALLVGQSVEPAQLSAMLRFLKTRDEIAEVLNLITLQNGADVVIAVKCACASKCRRMYWKKNARFIADR